jgi:hypothetical protein
MGGEHDGDEMIYVGADGGKYAKDVHAEGSSLLRL